MATLSCLDTEESRALNVSILPWCTTATQREGEHKLYEIEVVEDLESDKVKIH